MSEDNRTVKLSCFDLAKDWNRSQPRTLCGTPQYAAPEVAHTHAHTRAHAIVRVSQWKIIMGDTYDHACDMWSLGCLCYVMLCGFNPFWSENMRDTLERMVAGTYTFLQDDRERLSPTAIDFVDRLLVVHPQNRMTAR